MKGRLGVTGAFGAVVASLGATLDQRALVLRALVARTASMTERVGFSELAGLRAALEAAATVENCAGHRVACLSAKVDRRPAPRIPNILRAMGKER